MGLQHVRQANANQPYNSRPRKSSTEWRFLSHSPLSLSLSLSFCLSLLFPGVVFPVGRIVLFSLLCFHADKPGGCRGSMFCSEAGTGAGRVAGCYQGVPDTSNCTTRSAAATILCLRHLAVTLQQCFYQSFSSLENLVSDYTVVGGGESQDFLMFYPKLNIHIQILANLCNKLKNLAKNLLFFVEQLSK